MRGFVTIVLAVTEQVVVIRADSACPAGAMAGIRTGVTVAAAAGAKTRRAYSTRAGGWRTGAAIVYSSKANAGAEAHRVGVIVDALVKNIADTRLAEVRGQVAVTIVGAASAGDQMRRKGAKQSNDDK